MRVARILTVTAIWAASLVGVAVWAQGGASQSFGTIAPVVQPGDPMGVITGDRIGVRLVHSMNGQANKVTGNLVVKINGEWVDVVPPLVIAR